MKKLRHLILSFVFAVFTIFWLSSYTYYNTFGIDSELRKNEQIENHYYRFWWPGNGSLLIGKSIILHPYNSNKTYTKFDLGAAFLRPPSDKIKAHSVYNKIGFWYIDLDKPIQQFWIGIPAWLPTFMIIGCFLFCRRRYKKSLSV
ncbi:MAG: hypothetical protein KAH03_05415 [Cocleimonas sp.]|nr:hypothetical protein [Cocleimonas sp.]